jgi:hypothetical protein
MSERDQIECQEHGAAFSTYVCRHLIEGTNTHWYSAEVDEANQWPDSWCAICNDSFAIEGEWNEKSERAAELGSNIELLCHHCYVRIRSQCTVHVV